MGAHGQAPKETQDEAIRIFELFECGFRRLVPPTCFVVVPVGALSVCRLAAPSVFGQSSAVRPFTVVLTETVTDSGGNVRMTSLQTWAVRSDDVGAHSAAPWSPPAHRAPGRAFLKSAPLLADNRDVV